MKPETTRIESFLGLRSDVKPERMGVGDLIDAVNVRFDQTGQAYRRTGHLKKQAGLANSLWSDGDVTLVVINGTLSRVRSGYSLVPLVTGIEPRTVIHFARVNALVYWSNGVQRGVIDPGNNTARSWGLPVPEVTSSMAVTGVLPPGRYQYATTYLRSDGQESGAGTSQIMDLPDMGGIEIVAPLSTDPDVVAVVLYLSTAGGTVLYRAAEIAPGMSGGYRGDGADLVMPLLTQLLTPPPLSSCFAWFAGRLWLAVDDCIFPSAPFSLELFDLLEYLPVTGNVTMLAPQPDGSGMWVGTDSHTMYLTGNDPRDMRVDVRLIEPVIAGTLTRVPGDRLGDGTFAGADLPVWAGSRGMYAGLPDGRVLPLNESRYPLSLSGQGAAYFDRDTRHLVVSAG